MKNMSEAFRQLIPDSDLSPGEIQGFLINRKPEKAFEEAQV